MVLTILVYAVRKVLPFRESMSCIAEGFKDSIGDIAEGIKEFCIEFIIHIPYIIVAYNV